jgi:hypothetical protein
MRKLMRILPALTVAILIGGCGKHCEEVPGDVSSTERAWIAYAPGQAISFVNLQGDTGVLTAGPIEERWHNGGGSKGDCDKDYESLHQPLAGLGLVNAELAVVHDRETGNAPGYVCGYYMDGAPVSDVVIHGTSYDDVYISWDSSYYFSKAAGLIKAHEWEKLP